MTYTQVLNETLSIYREKGEEAAYEFVSKEAKILVGDYPQIDNFRYALAAAIGKKEEAMALMREAIESKGYWYSHEYLKQDDDLDALRGDPDFEKWLLLCQEREEEALSNAESKILLLGNEGEEKPLLLVLHGNQENLEITKPYWEAAVGEGYLLALEQSSQIEFSHGYNWNDSAQGVAEVGTYYEALSKEGLVGEEVWVGGFSAGCGVALRAMLDGAIPATHFIFMAPWLPELEEWKEELSALEAAGVSGHILVGDRDRDCQEGAELFAEYLKVLGIPVTFEKIEGLDHDYPEDFHQRLKSWLALKQ
jgi:acetyl esterase/lipase